LRICGGCEGDLGVLGFMNGRTVWMSSLALNGDVSEMASDGRRLLICAKYLRCATWD
jgi:hypothetical protein